MDKAARRSRAQQPVRWRGRQLRARRVRATRSQATSSQDASSPARELAGRWWLEADGHCFGKESLT
ncbi:UNVERIFIED_CONTAM: hypothetical protein Slati_2392100 [Sesamum latifolium]|uniref:Uncharacterized protein n=1 Tax=Sesamum latifolium TaxID=2727402 RepID=A0AAW2WGM9_9LAMI